MIDPASEASAETAAPDPASDALFAISLHRIEWLIPCLALLGAVVLAVRGLWPLALGFLTGAAISYLNFRWLRSTVAALSDALTETETPRSRPSVVFRFIIRFVLIALAAYVIFVSYPLAFRGFLGGLFVPVVAIFVEAIVVVSSTIRRGP